MAEETVVIVCPNPECRRDIEEPIILTVRSVTPAEEYEACPYCFARLNQEPLVELEEVPEPTVEQEEDMEDDETVSPAENLVQEEDKDSGQGILKKVRSLIPRSSDSKKKHKKTKEPQVEPSGEEEKMAEEKAQTEPVIQEEAKTEPQIEQPEEETLEEEPKTEPVATKENGFSGCTRAFGYLANRSPDTPIPQECMLCPKIVECMLALQSD